MKTKNVIFLKTETMTFDIFVLFLCVWKLIDFSLIDLIYEKLYEMDHQMN